MNQTADIAPFEDHNNNGTYEPMMGDAPIIKGDQALYFVMNDARKPHTETEGLSLGIEIHAMAYAYNMPDDSALWSTIFLQYKIINKSDTLYTDSYTGFFVDTELGFSFDDNIGCNIHGGYFYSYNGDSIDGISGQPGVYGENPPAIAVLFLGGPLLDEDGLDNPKYDMSGNQICDESINGLNFGDSIVDNERLGMTDFMYFNNGGIQYMTDPDIAPEYYNYLKSFWIDGSSLQYGGIGHPLTGAVGPECRYIFSGNSDSCNWGTNGIIPNGNLNTPGNYWTEESVGNNPSDRRGLGSSGPFTFAPGQEETLDLAFVWARAYDGNPWSSAELLEGYCSYIKDKFENDETFFVGINQNTKNNEHLLVYPNPATEFINVKTPRKNGKGLVNIYNNHGVLIFSKATDRKTDYSVDVHGWIPGLYFVRYISENGLLTGSFIKL